MRLTWLGHSTVLVHVDGLTLLADPLLRTRTGALRRAVPLPDAARRLAGGTERVDAVLLSHLHHDHCDLPSLRALDAPLVLAPPGAGGWLRDRGVRGVVELGPGDTTRLGPAVTVTAVPADHHGRREPWGPLAESVGHLVTGSRSTAWLAGDTGLMAGMADLPALSAHGTVHLAAVPVWGWGPNLGPGHLDPRAAAEAVVLTGALLSVPVHWGTLFPVGLRRAMRRQLRDPGPSFARHLAALSRDAQQAVVLAPGEDVDAAAAT